MFPVTRQDAVASQLDTAIRLWFEDSDVISTHTLACSALKIAHDVATKHNKGGMLWNALPGKYHKAATEAQNFFKHAEKDPIKVLSFNKELTKYHIYDALKLYSALYLSMTAPMGTFLIWCSLHEPRIGVEKLTGKLAIIASKDSVVCLKRQEFWSNVCPMLGKQ